MFTGIVEDLGEIEAIEQLGDFARIHIHSATVTEDARPGDSIAVNGVCLTVTALLGEPPADNSKKKPGDDGDPSYNSKNEQPVPHGFTADVMGETLARTSLATAAPGTSVNLERSVRMQDRLGGHLVQGHVDGTATVISRAPAEHWEVVRISLPPELARYVVHKGSITVDGISLTVSAVTGSSFEVSLIPETLKRTTLGLRQPGELVNLEVDVMAKYVEKLLARDGAQ
jgi:riboflavin synthase